MLKTRDTFGKSMLVSSQVGELNWMDYSLKNELSYLHIIHRELGTLYTNN